MNRTIPVIFSLLVIGIFIPVNAQTDPIANHVVINEIDINPPGDDSVNVNEWIELYNPTDASVDLSGWQIASSTVLKKTLTIGQGTTLGSGKFIAFSYQPVWFTDISEVVELRDKNGFVIDKTPSLSDLKNDFTSWQRIYDGYDLDSIEDWKFVTSTAGSSNGKLPVTEESGEVRVSISVDKSSYIFGETVNIKGNVSEEIFVVKPFFHQEPIIVTIKGPDFIRELTLYPDLNLNYKTSLSLHQVLGINEGPYEVTANYAGAFDRTSFTVGTEIISTEEVIEGDFTITSDKSQYIPGQTVVLTAFTTETIPFEGLKFRVIDPNRNVIYTGTLFPVDGKFTTTVFLSTVNPVYGTYEIIGEYVDKSASTTFQLLTDVKEDKTISLWTDKEVYGLGETVTITGRLNTVWVNALDLEIVQSKNLATTEGGSILKINDIVRLSGDGSFKYTFTIPDGESRLGDYRIKVSQDVGSETKTIVIVENPEDYILIDEPLTLTSNKSVYNYGEKVTISGKIRNPEVRSSYETPSVIITVTTADGRPIEMIANTWPGAKTLSRGGTPVGIEFTAVPDSSGRFSLTTELPRTTFGDANFIITAKYSTLSKSIPISFVDPLESGESIITLDKEVYGLGETVMLSGLLPPTGESAVTITLTKPDGSKINSGATLDAQRFSWSWQTPIAEKQTAIKTDDRSLTTTNLGIYKIKVSTASQSKDLFFKVSLDPENDNMTLNPIFVTTEKPLYQAGEKLKVVGTVIKREQGEEGLVVPERVTIQVLDGVFPFPKIHEAFVYPDLGGNFKSTFELPPTIFSEGQYKIKAVYQNRQTETIFSVANDFSFGLDEPVSLIASTDKPKYYPGETVVVTGKPNKLIYLEKYDVSVIKKSEVTEITCGSFFCGKHFAKPTTIRPSPSGSFTYSFQLEDSSSSIGEYEVTIDADFELKSITFPVVERPPQPEPIVPKKIIEKVNRIEEDQISIVTEEKLIDGIQASPRVVMGTLITPARGEEASINLKVSADSGVCVIGPAPECLVNDSTRKPGSIYDVVEVGEMLFNVRYSGPDARVEKFSILPESGEATLPDSSWTVEVLKGEQASRLYYKINYSTE